MPIATLGDMLDHSREFELRLDRYYSDIRDLTADNGVRLLAYYLARHRRHMELAFADCEPSQVAHFRKTELKPHLACDLEKKLCLLGTAPAEVSGPELLDWAVRYHQDLVSLYRAILMQPLIDEIHIVLEALIDIKERDIGLMKKMMAMRYF